MHAAPLTFPRLQRLLSVLKDGRPRSTRSIIRRANICAINSCIAGLRQHGAEISCPCKRVGEDWRFCHTMTKGPTDA